MQTVAIAGVGLLGGSFALALRKAGFTGRILGVSSPATIEKAIARKVIDEGLPLEAAVRASDLIYLAQPIQTIVQTIRQIGPWLKPDALVTDVGSTKRQILKAAAESLSPHLFLGGHPMAGKESSGVEHADADLFRGRRYILSPLSGGSPTSPLRIEFENWIDAIGATRVVMDAETHDRTVAYTSHLPQLLSTTLGGLLVSAAAPEEPWRVAGPGLDDMLRLSGSGYHVWSDILETNQDFILEALQSYRGQLDGTIAALTDKTLQSCFAEGTKAFYKVRHR